MKHHANTPNMMVTKGLQCADAGSACRYGTRLHRFGADADAPEPLAHGGATWHAARMQGSQRSPRAGGAAIALLALAGAVIGNHYGQASIGLLAGLASGGAIALTLWALDRRRD